MNNNVDKMVSILVLGILIWLSVSDIRTRNVSRRVLMFWGILTIVWQVVSFYRVYQTDGNIELADMNQSAWTGSPGIAEICGGIGVGILFLAVSKITDEAIGYGDSMAILILGGYLGFWKAAGVLAGAFFLSGICSIVLAVRGQIKPIPFFPFLTLGYVLILAEQGGVV